VKDSLTDERNQKSRPDWLEFLLKEWLLFASVSGLVLTSFYLERIPRYSVQDFEVLYILFVLFVIIEGLEKSGFFSKVSSGLEKGRNIPAKLVFATMALAMFVTNDVALLVVVPMTLKLNIKKKDWIVVLEALAANAGSALTPFGNPQNLFIYWFYHLHPGEFVRAIAPFTAVFFVILILLAGAVKAENRERTQYREKTAGSFYLYLSLLVVFVLAVLRLLPIWVGVGVVAYAFLWDRKSLKVDYALLATFFCFFGLTDNLKTVFMSTLENSKYVFIFSALVSQFMSNVPSTLLFADFTTNWKALLWGVNVGGFGSLLGSLANIIAYRLYANSTGYGRGDSRRFLVKFHALSYCAFAIGIALYYVLTLRH